jgi:hypothetical protein
MNRVAIDYVIERLASCLANTNNDHMKAEIAGFIEELAMNIQLKYKD